MQPAKSTHNTLALLQIWELFLLLFTVSLNCKFSSSHFSFNLFIAQKCARERLFHQKAEGMEPSPGHRVPGHPPYQILPPAVLPAKTPSGQIHLVYSQRFSSLLDCSEPAAITHLLFYSPWSLFSVSWAFLFPKGPLLAWPGAPTPTQQRRDFTPIHCLGQSREN